MGGKIYVESKVGYGSTFTVEIPKTWWIPRLWGSGNPSRLR